MMHTLILYFRLLETVQECLALYENCAENTLYTTFSASVQTEFDQCPDPEPDTCPATSADAYVACYSSLTVYLSTCSTGVAGCMRSQVCL